MIFMQRRWVFQDTFFWRLYNWWQVSIFQQKKKMARGFIYGVLPNKEVQAENQPCHQSSKRTSAFLI